MDNYSYKSVWKALVGGHTMSKLEQRTQCESEPVIMSYKTMPLELLVLVQTVNLYLG